MYCSHGFVASIFRLLSKRNQQFKAFFIRALNFYSFINNSIKHIIDRFVPEFSKTEMKLWVEILFSSQKDIAKTTLLDKRKHKFDL